MTVTITYFVHGTTRDNEIDYFSGWSDIGLSEKGVEEAKDLAELVQDKHFDVVFTSDLRRAVDSAKMVWEGKTEIIEDERLREADCGEPVPWLDMERIQEQTIHTPMFGGESYKMVEARVAEFLDDLKRNYDDKNVAVMSHRSPQLAFEVLLAGKTWKEAFIDDWRKTKAWRPGWTYLLG